MEMTSVFRKILAVGLVSVACLASAHASGKSQPGLTVVDGVFIRDGKPYKGVGVNYFDAFARTLANPKDTSYREGFKTLAKYNIQFCRVMWGGFWPSEDKLYFKDKKAYFKLMDGVVKSAEENGVGLIPSLFWNQSTVPDMVNEPCNQWGNPNSKTIAFMRNYVKEVVTRYRIHRPSGVGSLATSSTSAPTCPTRRRIDRGHGQSLGCPATRSEKDDYTHAITRSAYNEFAKAVRKYDSYRFIEGGDGFPRSNAWNGMVHNTWDTDTEKQYAEMITGDCPDPMNALSGHQYDVVEDRCGRRMPV